MHIEISAYRQLTAAVETVNNDMHLADGVAVYLCNPVALHLKDWPLAEYPGDSGARLHKALADAHAWAEEFVDHISEPKTLIIVKFVQPPEPIPLSDLLDAAATLWEAVIDAEAKPNSPTGRALAIAREADGTSSLRYLVTGWAEECHRAWMAARAAGFDDSFDWEFCPVWLAEKVKGHFPAVES